MKRVQGISHQHSTLENKKPTKVQAKYRFAVATYPLPHDIEKDSSEIIRYFNGVYDRNSDHFLKKPKPYLPTRGRILFALVDLQSKDPEMRVWYAAIDEYGDVGFSKCFAGRKYRNYITRDGDYVSSRYG